MNPFFEQLFALTAGLAPAARAAPGLLAELRRFLAAILPELTQRAVRSGVSLPLELGLTVGERRWLLHIEAKGSRVEPDKLSRRHLTLSRAALVSVGGTLASARDERARPSVT